MKLDEKREIMTRIDEDQSKPYSDMTRNESTKLIGRN